MDEARFYRQSGGFSPAALLVPSIMIPVSFLIGIVYAYIDLYIPIAGYITVFVTFGAGFAAGVANVLLLRALKVRNQGVAWIWGVLAGLMLLYFSWGAFEYALLKRGGGEGVGLFALLGNPAAVWSLAAAINKEGWFDVFSLTPTGPLLWACWTLEALILVGMPTLVSGVGLNDDVFCEACDAWAEEEEDFLRLKLEEGDDPAPALKEGDPSPLLRRQPLGKGPGRYLKVDVTLCRGCDSLHTLSVSQVTETVDEDGDPDKEEDDIITNLLITERQYQDLVKLKDSVPADPEAPEQEGSEGDGEGESRGR